jgi:hypothetical protein
MDIMVDPPIRVTRQSTCVIELSLMSDSLIDFREGRRKRELKSVCASSVVRLTLPGNVAHPSHLGQNLKIQTRSVEVS